MMFKKFSQELVKLLKKCFMSIGQCRSSSAKRGRLWVAFHQVSIKELPRLWSNFLVMLQIDCKEPLSYQTVNLLIFEELLKEHFGTPASNNPTNSKEDIVLSKDELMH